MFAVKRTEADGTLFVAVPNWDMVDIYHGNKQVTSVSISFKTARALAWFLLWRYVICWSWFGLRLKLYKRKLCKHQVAQAKRNAQSTAQFQSSRKL